MSSQDERTPAIRRSYVIPIIALFLLIAVLGPFLGPKWLQTMRDFGLLPKSMNSSLRKSLSPRIYEADTTSAELSFKGDISESRTNAQAFLDWIEVARSADITIIRPPRYEVRRTGPLATRNSTLQFEVIQTSEARPIGNPPDLELICNNNVNGTLCEVDRPIAGTNFIVTVKEVSGFGEIGLQVDARHTAFYEVRIPAMGLLAAHSTMGVCNPRTGMVENWRVKLEGDFIDNRFYRKGDVVQSRHPAYRSYQVLSICRKCVWLLALRDDEPVPDFPKADWSDCCFGQIHGESDGEGGRIEVRKGLFADTKVTILIGAEGERLKAEQFWEHAVHFRYFPGIDALPSSLLFIRIP